MIAANGLPASAIAPWEAEPYRLWSLRQIAMERLEPLAFIDIGRMFGSVGAASASVGDQDIGDTLRPVVIDVLQERKELFNSLGFTSSERMVQRLLKAVASPITFVELNRQFDELVRRVEDEAGSTLFLYLQPNKTHYYEDPLGGWSETIARFPSIIFDVEEAAKCIALSRNTAAVFHLMRIMEIGLFSLATKLEVPGFNPRTNPSWDSVLKKCHAEMSLRREQRSQTWLEHARFFEEATATLEAAKLAWRNPTMHVEGVYDEERTADVWLAVRAFMRHLSTKLTDPSVASDADASSSEAS